MWLLLPVVCRSKAQVVHAEVPTADSGHVLVRFNAGVQQMSLNLKYWCTNVLM